MHNVTKELWPLLKPIDSAKPDPRNARIHPQPNLEAIKRSLEAYGQRKPIVVNNSTGIIEAGNGLWQAAKELGWTEIAMVRVEDDENNASGYAIMDNQSALLAEWDLPVLKDILEGLDSGAFDMDLTGFDEKAIEDLMTQFNPDEVEHKSLAERFIVPPFSVLDARQGYWQERKRAWLSLGVQSELGRGVICKG
jgi:ParB-like chromosome segregation protein Spo0J